ncbi:hypothetical protein HMPREF9628_00143 [Peptoanaerobacter stomatis]|uniref:Uncharacterized protein n=1 Tax=Peptoanaerobacter stomatis TaxID=796937 RepID=G9XA52_9FIRM|nr:hypothetical protein [Peptoanaerobacter stomatis]EHL20298.1 hypothetical protein HMPREF9628_00143 [Peptoanaerobacter stomatis]
MAKYIALISFAGTDISAYQGQEIEIENDDIAENLVDIGYLLPVEKTSEEKGKSARGKKK